MLKTLIISMLLVLNITTYSQSISKTSKELPIYKYSSSVSDIDGNNYKTVVIGSKQWMGENLKTTKYNDGSVINNVVDNIEWSESKNAAWSYYNNDTLNNKKYGKLYNWNTVNKLTNGNKNVCPNGWHIPTINEWNILVEYLGGKAIAGGKMKEQDTITCVSPNTGASNISLFTALPGGDRGTLGRFYNGIGLGGYRWSSTEFDKSVAGNCFLYYKQSNIEVGMCSKDAGLSIRCLKD
jgi:uncharacterized protein (TIGR02145 family)